MNPQTVLQTGPLAARAVSGFALSIGTSLALESLFDPRQPVYDLERKIPPRIDLKKYKYCYINLATIFRNIVGSIDRVDFLQVTPAEIKLIMEVELDIIISLFQIEGQNLCQPVFYYCTYETVYTKQKHNAVHLRQDKTDGQKYNTATLLKTMQMFMREHKHLCQQFDSEITVPNRESAIIMTHIPYDLLSAKNFRMLDLLESHTGVLKTRSHWYTKFFKMSNEDLSTIPFIRKMLLIFGDNVMISPMDIRFRRLLLEISRKRRWTSHTTEDKIKLDLDMDIQERYLFDMYKIL